MSAPTESLSWLAPSPLWQTAAAGLDQPGFARPWLIELQTDEFVPEFLRRLSTPGSEGPSSLSDLPPRTGEGTYADPHLLYQPIHGCYYLVVGSLVCKRVGLPDRAVDPDGQRVSFVVRRLRADGREQAWVPDLGGWTDVTVEQALWPGEEQLPMHGQAVGAPAGDDPMARFLGLDEPGRRTVHYGYVPVAARTVKPQPVADPVAAALASTGVSRGDDPRLMEFRVRIAGAWSDLSHQLPVTDVKLPSLLVLLELKDWLLAYLPGVFDALVGNTVLNGAPHAELLRLALDKTITKNGSPYLLRDALGELRGYAALGTTLDTPSPYDLRVPPAPAAGFTDYFDELSGHGPAVGGKVWEALDAREPAARVGAPRISEEMRAVVVARPDPTVPAAVPDRHVIRLVYQHDPCAPVVSPASPVLRFASTYEPDAPARSIRIQLPDPSHLRRYTHGVSMEMSPKLRELMDKVHPGMLKGEGLKDGASWGLGMICSFSIEIVFMVAFVVMFIFLLLLNIVFWWMAFLKICLPIPTRKQ